MKKHVLWFSFLHASDVVYIDAFVSLTSLSSVKVSSAKWVRILIFAVFATNSWIVIQMEISARRALRGSQETAVCKGSFG